MKYNSITVYYADISQIGSIAKPHLKTTLTKLAYLSVSHE